MIKKKEWSEFRKTGLLVFVNSFLHIFGWCIVLEIDEDQIIDVYPARTGFRGFDTDTTSKSYISLSNYIKDNIDDIVKEAES